MSIKKFYLVFSVIIAFVVLCAWISGVWSPKDSPLLYTPETISAKFEQERETPLNAQVVLNSLYVKITNKDPFRWSAIKMKINSDYELEADAIEAGTVGTFPMSEFSKSDGTRLNFFTVKPKQVLISAQTPNGRRYYTGTW